MSSNYLHPGKLACVENRETRTVSYITSIRNENCTYISGTAMEEKCTHISGTEGVLCISKFTDSIHCPSLLIEHFDTPSGRQCSSIMHSAAVELICFAFVTTSAVDEESDVWLGLRSSMRQNISFESIFISLVPIKGSFVSIPRATIRYCYPYQFCSLPIYALPSRAIYSIFLYVLQVSDSVTRVPAAGYLILPEKRLTLGSPTAPSNKCPAAGNDRRAS